MTSNAIGTEANPLRVAIVGAGPTGFYTAEHLFKQKDRVIEVEVSGMVFFDEKGERLNG